MRSIMKSDSSNNGLSCIKKSDEERLQNIVKLLNTPPSHIAYFNNAGKVPIPHSVQQAGLNSLLHESSPWTESSKSNSDITRSLFAKLIHADSCEIAICPSTGFAMTMVAHNLLRTGVLSKTERNKILILQDEMSSQVYSWQEVMKECKSELLVVPHPTVTDGNWTNIIINMLMDDENQNISVVCTPQVHWSDGSYLDLKQIGEECRKRNIVFVVDGTQSVGICPLNVKEIECHILACSVHKWLLGPHGSSLVYVHSKFHGSWLPLDQHERSRAVFQNEVYDATENNIDCHNGYPEEFVPGAARLDSGGKKNPILLPMVNEGLRIVIQIDLIEAQKYLKSLTDAILNGGEKIGFGVQSGPRAGHIIGLRPKSIKLCNLLTPSKMVDIAHILEEKYGVYLAVRCGCFRIAPYLDTTMDDVEKLLRALENECR